MILEYIDVDNKPVKIRLRASNHTPPVTIGRGEDVTLTILDSRCSRVNCAIRYWDDIFIIRDMGSRNGTYVNGKLIDVARLNPGDTIHIGDTEIKVYAEEESPLEVTVKT